MTAAKAFSEAPYLAAEFAVLSAMQEETIRDVNNRQSLQSRVTDSQRGIQKIKDVDTLSWLQEIPASCILELTAESIVFYIRFLFSYRCIWLFPPSAPLQASVFAPSSLSL